MSLHIDIITNIQTHTPMKNIQEIISENTRRKAMKPPILYDPLTGNGCNGNRQKILIHDHGLLYLPTPMINDYKYSESMPWNNLCKLRFKYDFEFWCSVCVKVKDKSGNGLIPFILNSPQRKVLKLLESMRCRNLPIRAIILKARQWGASTLINAYMAWIQLELTRFHNSIACAHNKETANVLKGMYDNIILNYPSELWLEDELLAMKPIGGSRNLFNLKGVNSTYLNCSAVSQNLARGSDISMAHMSEVAYYPNSSKINARNLISSICSSITLNPLTLVIFESTANGVGNYFHTEWINAVDGKSDKKPIFVAWHEIEIYTLPVDNYESLINEMDEYEFKLFYDGISLEQINWYHCKRKEFQSHFQMMAEYPSDATEAFNANNNGIFSPDDIEKLRLGCAPPLQIGEIQGNADTGPLSLENIRFIGNSRGLLNVWVPPDNSVDMRHRYVVAVDIGGRSASSDFSVIAVFDRKNPDYPELVAQWRGHIDHDILAWKSAQIAKWYNSATLIIESNTLEADRTEGDHGEYILNQINRHYRRLYRRDDGSPGFHTNRASKTRIVNALIGIYRDKGYVEHDENALNEALTFERLPNGAFGAKVGLHDDLLITRALALSFCKDLRLREIGQMARAHDLKALLI